MMEEYLLEKHVTDSNNFDILTQDDINSLNAALSKNSINILITLYRTPHIQHKVLAANVHTSANSLSNMINRIAQIYPSLLHVNQIGRSKYYSLTKKAELYVAEELLPKKTSKIHNFVSPSQDAAITNETLDILNQFQTAAGSNWSVAMDNMLCNGITSDTDNYKLHQIYINFINNMKQLRIRKKETSIRTIYDILENSILIARLESFLNMELKTYNNLLPLLDLENQNFTKAFILIDRAFAEQKPLIFKQYDKALYDREISISDGQYHAIYYGISIMMNEFSINYHGNKTMAIEQWAKSYLPDTASLQYIAEKCHMIYLIENNRSTV